MLASSSAKAYHGLIYGCTMHLSTCWQGPPLELIEGLDTFQMFCANMENKRFRLSKIRVIEYRTLLVL